VGWKLGKIRQSHSNSDQLRKHIHWWQKRTS